MQKQVFKAVLQGENKEKRIFQKKKVEMFWWFK
jgi:hypothetical protein